MSEMPKIPTTKQEFDDAFNAIVDAEKERTPPTHEEQVSLLAERFEASDTEHTLEELGEMSEGISQEWQEQGFNPANSYLDVEGNLILIAGSKNNEHSSMRKRGEGPEKTWRFLIDGVATEVTIPPEWSGSSMHFRGSGHFEGVYRLPDQGKDVELPEDIQRIVDKLGTSVTMSTNAQWEHSLGNEGTVALSEVSGRVHHKKVTHEKAVKAEYEADEAEAYEVEGTGQLRASKVRKGLFRSAKRLAELRHRKYRIGLAEKTYANMQSGAKRHSSDYRKF